MIRSTRIRIARNIKDFTLGPGLSNVLRQSVEDLIKEEVTSFDGDIAGKYYSLASMSEEDIQKMTAEHFMLKEGDRFQDAAGLNNNWPESRGIFLSNDKKFLIWVNEEDQLRIISTQEGADINDVFARLSKAAGIIEKKFNFECDSQLGYITSCPSNLGTALRASVHIHLPYLCKDKQKLREIAEKYNVQVLGTHGGETDVFDISNSRRLGISEV